MEMEKVKETCLDWGAAAAVMPGQIESGDIHLVVSTSSNTVLAVLDGLGHGSEAAAASRAATEVIRAHADEPIISLLTLCHECLRQTRGAVISLASFNLKHPLMTWASVGNVAGFLLRADHNLPNETLLSRGGVVGVQLPPLQAAVLPVCHGDVLVFATDGVRTDFTESITVNLSLQTTAERILAKYNKGIDDALVVVARYRNIPS